MANKDATDKDPEEQLGGPLDELILAALRDQGWPDKLDAAVKRQKGQQELLHAGGGHTGASFGQEVGSWLPDGGSTPVRIRSHGWEDPVARKSGFTETVFMGSGETLPVAREATIDARYQLMENCCEILQQGGLTWTSEYRLEEVLGYGGQGLVFLASSGGADEFVCKSALKIFSPLSYRDAQHYTHAMQRMAKVASVVAGIHHANLLNVQRFEQRNGIRMMVMEFVDGYDLERLLVPNMRAWLKQQLPREDWLKLNKVVVTGGIDGPRLQPGVAVEIIRHCLKALKALHDRRIVHADIKPSNIMLRAGGDAKIIDMGSAFPCDDPLDDTHPLTLAYAAPEVHRDRHCTPQSDLASLGYVLIEMLSGCSLFSASKTADELLEKKRALPDMIEGLLTPAIAESKRLVALCRRLIAPDPLMRFASAYEAEVDPVCGAHAFHQELYEGRLGAFWNNDMRLWIEALRGGKHP